MSTRVNGQAADTVSAHDRGLSYGDGLFETMRRVRGGWPLWSRHMQRLDEGCRRLGLPAPDSAWLARECELACDGMSDAVLRLTVTRGLGPRGYAPPASPEPSCIVRAGPLPELRRDWYHHGVTVRRCRTRLAAQPRLAGIKHLNRLEQVLARSEWQDPDIAEGLMCDFEGHVVSATAANLFAVLGGELTTPALDACGVAGVARAEVLAQCPAAAVRPVAWSELADAGEVFLTSSVRGILPVGRIAGAEQQYPVGPACRQLQAHWRAAGILPECGA